MTTLRVMMVSIYRLCLLQLFFAALLTPAFAQVMTNITADIDVQIKIREPS